MRNIELTSLREEFREQLSSIYEPLEIKSLFQLVCEFVFRYSKTDLLVKDRVEVPSIQLEKYYQVLNELKRSKPIQYITNQTEFYGLTFYVNEHVLIPRQETEELVDLTLSNHPESELSIIDIGTGSGIIPITLKANKPKAKIFGVDVSLNALDVAVKNAKQHNVEIYFQELNILNECDWEVWDKQFNIIVSNPPYIAESEKQLMHPNVLNFEPSLALFVPDNDPLLFYKKITLFAKEKLYKGGTLYFEINEQFGKETAQILQENDFNNVKVIKDINSKDRFVVGIKD